MNTCTLKKRKENKTVSTTKKINSKSLTLLDFGTTSVVRKYVAGSEFEVTHCQFRAKP